MYNWCKVGARKVGQAASRGLMLMLLFLLVVSMLPGPPPSAGASDPALDWEFRALPVNDLKSVAWGNHVFVAVGADNSILISPDGESWSRTTHVPELILGVTLNGVTWGNDKFVIVGDAFGVQGLVLTSPDGETWQYQNPLINHSLNDVTWAQDQFIAVGNNGTILTSNTGIVWTSRNSGTSSQLYGIFSSSYSPVVAVGAGGTVLTSPNGIDWEAKPPGIGSDLHGLNERIFFTGVFPNLQLVVEWVAVGSLGTIVATTDFGDTWYPQTSGTFVTLFDVERYDSKYVAVGAGGTILTSPNGVTWTGSNLGSSYILRGVAHNGDQIVSVGDTGLIYSASLAEPWTYRNGGTPIDLNGITWGDGQYAAVGTSTLTLPGEGPQMVGYGLTSPDGETWTGYTLGLGNRLNDILWTGSRFAAVGDNGVIFTSLDGETWTAKTSGSKGHIFGLSFYTYYVSCPPPDYLCQRTRLVAVGDEIVLTSDDHGDTWTLQVSGGGMYLRSVTRYQNQFIAVGEEGSIFTSPNGTTWSGDFWFTAGDLTGVAAGNDTWVAVGNNGTILSSFDAETWTSRASGTSNNLKDVIWTGSHFVAGGEYGTLLTSPDGIQWTLNFAGTRNHIEAFTTSADRIIAAGAHKTLLSALKEAALPVSGVSLEEEELYLVAGGSTSTLTAAVEPSNATNPGLSWHSSNETVATVSGGVVTPLTAGTALITVITDDGGFTDSCQVTVLEPVSRIAGDNRYSTAVGVSQQGWLAGAGTVVLARGDNFADALAGVPLAYQLDAPILLTRTGSLPGETLAEIQRLGAQKVLLLGGPTAIGDAVKDALEDLGLEVERIAGDNRYQTAALIAQRLQAEGAVFDTAFIAVGTNFADALAASSYAARRGQPILLTRTGSLPDATEKALDDLEIDYTIVCGGEGAISQDVFNQLPNPVRIAGPDRYATAVALAEEFLPAETKHVSIATGQNFPDAIAGGVLAAKLNSGVLLVRGISHQPNPVVQTFLESQGVTSVTLFGGPAVISSEMEAWFRDWLE